MMSPLSRCNQNAAKRTLTTGGRGHTPEIAQSSATTGSTPVAGGLALTARKPTLAA
jgi:hypothetical protein